MKNPKPKNIAILCTQLKSIYNHLSKIKEINQIANIHTYNKKNNAFNFPGKMAVIAHPPCRIWGKLSHFNKQTPTEVAIEKKLGIFCVSQIIENGGILEQPFNSKLFNQCKLPPGGMANEKGFTLEIPQRIFGHLMIKNTLLFFSKINYKDLEPFLPLIHNKHLKPIQHLSHKQREATPISLAKWLIRQAIKVK